MTTDLDRLVRAIKALPQTGSTAYGMPNPGDDDRYCNNKDFDSLRKQALTIPGISIIEKEGNSGGPETQGQQFKVRIEGTLYNVFAIAQQFIPGFAAATLALKAIYVEHNDTLLATALRNDKDFRVLLFRSIVNTVTYGRRDCMVYGGDNRKNGVPSVSSSTAATPGENVDNANMPF